MATPRKVRPKPRVSLKQLSEHVTTASSHRRKKIVEEAKYPNTFITVRYDAARKWLKRFVTSGLDMDILEKGIDQISKMPIDGKWDKDTRDNCIASLQRAKHLDLSILSKYDITPLKDWETLKVAGVEVSVYPDLLLRHKKTNKVGALVFHIGKTRPLKGDGLCCSAAVIKRYLSETQTAAVDLKGCIAIDVFAGSSECAPSAIVGLMKDIEASCEDIARSWADA